MLTPKTKPKQWTLKQVFVRNYNWRMGQLARLRHGPRFSAFFQDDLEEAYYKEVERQKTWHEKGMWAITPEKETFEQAIEAWIWCLGEPYLVQAIWETDQTNRMLRAKEEKDGETASSGV